MHENDQDQQGLNAKQEAFLTAYLASNNITTSAQQTGIADKTARRLVKLPAFQEAYQAARKELFNHALDGLMLYVDTAIDTLKRHMTNDETPPAAQIRAAQIYLDQAIQIHKMSDLEAKYLELEQLVKQQER